MSSIRDCVKEAIDHYHSGQQLEVNRDLSRLNSLYDNFIKEHGYLNSRKNLLAFNSDPDSSLLQSLEIWNSKTKIATKAEIFLTESLLFVKNHLLLLSHQLTQWFYLSPDMAVLICRIWNHSPAMIEIHSLLTFFLPDISIKTLMILSIIKRPLS